MLLSTFLKSQTLVAMYGIPVQDANSTVDVAFNIPGIANIGSYVWNTCSGWLGCSYGLTTYSHHLPPSHRLPPYTHAVESSVNSGNTLQVSFNNVGVGWLGQYLDLTC